MSQTSETSLNECPACGVDRFDDSFDTIGNVCKGCGLVIQDGTASVVLDWQITHSDSEQASRKDWLTECRIQNATEQRLSRAFADLEKIASDLSIPDETRREVVDLYCEAFRSKTTDGRDTTCMIAACLRLASLNSDVPIPIGRLTGLPNVNQKKFRLCLNALQDDLELQSRTAQPIDYIPFLSSILDLSDSQRRNVAQKLEDIDSNPSLVGKDPTGIAAASTYLTTSDQIQSDVADAVGVSTETVRKRVNQLRDLDAYD